MRQMEMAPDTEDARLVSDKFCRLGLAAVNDQLDAKLIDSQPVLCRVILHVVDATEPDPISLFHH